MGSPDDYDYNNCYILFEDNVNQLEGKYLFNRIITFFPTRMNYVQQQLMKGLWFSWPTDE